MARRKPLHIVLALTFVLAPGWNGTLAGRRSEGVDPANLQVLNGATSSGFGVTLPDAQQGAQDPLFVVHFMPPRGYRQDSEIEITLYYVSGTSASCGDYTVFIAGAFQFSPGGPAVLIPDNGGTALPEDLSTHLPSAGSEIREKTYILAPGGAVTFKEGDVFQIVFRRDVFDTGDTCTDSLLIVGIRVDYRTK